VRFGFVHRLMTDALAALGILALIVSGQFSRWVSGSILVALALVLVARDAWQKLPLARHFEKASVLAVLALEGGRIATGVNLLDVLVEFAAALQIIRLATRKGAAHDQQVIVLALLHLVAGTVLGGGVGYGLCFLGVLVVAPGALVLSHLRREVEGNYRQGARDRTGLPVDVPRILRSRRVVGKSFLAITCLLSVPIFVFTALLFVLFPRVGLSLLLLNRQHGGRMVGFSGRVDLGEVGLLRSDPTLAMRVEVPNQPEPPPSRLTLHLRGTALDAYDGRAWSQSDTSKRPADVDGNLVALESFPSPTDPILRIDLEPIDPPVVFIPPYATGLRFRGRQQVGLDASPVALRGAEGEMRYAPPDDRGIKYDVFLSPKHLPTFRDLNPVERARYLALPAKLPKRVGELAAEWTKDAPSPLEKAHAIEAHLVTEYRYDLASPSGRAAQPLDDFLFESKRGHCEFYSTAMAVMLRTLGVPTRNVTGFIGGTYNKYGRFYAVRQGDAHSWVEAYVEGRGWLTFDPTPPADAAPRSEVAGFWANLRDLLEATSQRWERHVVGYDLAQQVGLLQSLSMRYRRPSTKGGEASAPRVRVVVLVGLFGIAGVVGYVWLKRRGARAAAAAEKGSGRTPSSRLATALYEALEGAMAAQGVPRPPSTPPLRHAEALAGLEHPLAGEVLALTRIYLEARFGGAPIEDRDRREFERRVKALRAAEPTSPRPARLTSPEASS
jgi:transglutaminase-like putative cysteine protease